MNRPTILMRGTIAAAFTVALLSASPAAAQLSEDSLDCRTKVAKRYDKLVKTANKTLAKCHKSRNGGKILDTVDCNDMAQADADKGKYQKAVDKTVEKLEKDCPGDSALALTAGDIGGAVGESEFFVNCRVDPCTGVTGVVDTRDEIGRCLGCSAAQIAEDAGTATLGSPVPVDLDKDEQKCHAEIAKGYGKYLSTALKSETSCQKGADATGNYDLTSCVDDDPKLKVDKALAKANEGLDKKCPGSVNLADLDTCSATSLGDIKTCNTTTWGDAKDDAFESAFEHPATGCPAAIRTTIRGRCSTQGSVAGDCSSGFETGTILNVGWKGLAHEVDVTDNYTLAFDVTCAGTDKGACGTCTSTGISYDNPQYQSFTRCLDDPADECDEPFGPDTDCGGQCGGGTNDGTDCTSDGDCTGGGVCNFGACLYFLGPPLAISAGGTPTCTLNAVNSDIVGGTGDPDLGTVDTTIDLRSIVHTGVSQSRPCPYCRNDATPQDGVRGGTCFGGPHDGDPCDVQGFDLNFANPNAPDNSPTAGNSLDCPPTSGANISGTGLSIQLPLTTGVSNKDAVDPCEAPNGGLECYCGVCSHDPTISCDDDAYCAGLSGGSTCGIGGGVARKPNNCTDGICTAATSDRGQCSTFPDVDQYCSGVLFASGKGVIACSSDADCDTYVSLSMDPDDWVCPGNDCGTCSVSSFRSCFNDPLSVSGTENPTNPILAGAFCLPPSSNGSVNNATGSPGPGTVQTDTLVELRY